jgi:hypothetical protein
MGDKSAQDPEELLIPEILLNKRRVGTGIYSRLCGKSDHSISIYKPHNT